MEELLRDGMKMMLRLRGWMLLNNLSRDILRRQREWMHPWGHGMHGHKIRDGLAGVKRHRSVLRIRPWRSVRVRVRMRRVLREEMLCVMRMFHVTETRAGAVEHILNEMFCLEFFVDATGYGEQFGAVAIHLIIMHNNGGAGFFLHLVDDLAAVADDHADAPSGDPHLERGVVRGVVLVVAQLGEVGAGLRVGLHEGVTAA